MPKATQVVFFTALLALLSGCTGCAGNGSAAAHREEATVRTLIHKEDSFESIYKTLTERGYQCSDFKPDEKGGQGLVCGKHYGHISCGWRISVQRYKEPDVDTFNISIIQTDPLLGSQC